MPKRGNSVCMQRPGGQSIATWEHEADGDGWSLESENRKQEAVSEVLKVAKIQTWFYRSPEEFLDVHSRYLTLAVMWMNWKRRSRSRETS